MKVKLTAPLSLLFTIIILGLLTISCSSSTLSAVPPTEIPDKAMEPTPISEDVDHESDDMQSVPDRLLSEEGPWWVFSTPDGHYAINPDGSGLTQFYSEPINYPHLSQIRIAPSGGHIAYLTGNDVYNTTLRVNEFPWQKLVIEKPLTSDSSEPGPDSMPGDPEMEAVRAMVDAPSMAFSPDGRYLAFMGAIDGPTSDLYLLSLDNYQTTRLTSGPSQGYQPVWSPDGKYIVHTGAGTFGTGAGYAMEGVWAAAADDSGVVTLYDPSGSGSEVIVGWVDNRTFVVHSWDPICGAKDLRTYNIETGKSVVLWPEYFGSVAFDPENAVAVVGVSFADCNSDGQAGLFRVPADGDPSLRIVEDRPRQIVWSPEANLFLASTEYGSIAIAPSGEFINLDQPQSADPLPVVAHGSRDLAWPGDSLWVGPMLGSPDNPPRMIF
ncbi:MAG: hypothetical protein V3V46_02290, partial [Anaerolineales bacterium]